MIGLRFQLAHIIAGQISADTAQLRRRAAEGELVALGRLGHPLGATGARLLTTLVHALARAGGRYGLLTMCEGGGQANVTIIERL
jgi:Thiolase, C-terminal domain